MIIKIQKRLLFYFNFDNEIEESFKTCFCDLENTIMYYVKYNNINAIFHYSNPKLYNVLKEIFYDN